MSLFLQLSPFNGATETPGMGDEEIVASCGTKDSGLDLMGSGENIILIGNDHLGAEKQTATFAHTHE
jgi:hypothetical protein